MNEVKRLMVTQSFKGGVSGRTYEAAELVEDISGDLVLHKDYKKLEQELSQTKAELEEAKKLLQECREVMESNNWRGDLQEDITQAFMAGQSDCGVDPSYSSAKAHFLSNQQNEDLAMDFSHLNFKQKMNGGVQALMFFDNGYGVSVVQSRHSYGGDQGKYELAVLEGQKDSWSLTYDTPITNDVLGYLSEHDVVEILNRVKNLDSSGINQGANQ